jgi:hypothetical protein
MWENNKKVGVKQIKIRKEKRRERSVAREPFQ